MPDKKVETVSPVKKPETVSPVKKTVEPVTTDKTETTTAFIDIQKAYTQGHIYVAYGGEEVKLLPGSRKKSGVGYVYALVSEDGSTQWVSEKDPELQTYLSKYAKPSKTVATTVTPAVKTVATTVKPATGKTETKPVKPEPNKTYSLYREKTGTTEEITVLADDEGRVRIKDGKIVVRNKKGKLQLIAVDDWELGEPELVSTLLTAAK